MKTAKSYKIILLLTAFVLSVVAAFSFLNVNDTVKASDDEVPTKYFTFTNIDTATASFTDGSLVFKPVDGTVEFNNKLVVSDFVIDVTIPTGVTAEISFTAPSYFEHGQEIDGEYKTDIEYKATLANGANAFTVKNNIPESGQTALTQYKVESVNGITVASVKISIKVADDATLADTDLFKLNSVGQKGSDASYVQDFTLTDGQLTKAYPRVVLDKSFYSRTEFGGAFKANKEIGKKYTVSMNAYSVLGSTLASNLYVQSQSADVILASGTDKPKSFIFGAAGEDYVLLLGEKDKDGNFVKYEAVDVSVKDYSADNKAPEYRSVDGLKFENGKLVVEDEENATVAQKETVIAYNGFLNALKNEHTTTNSEDKETSVYLGAELEIPSMADLVVDNYTAYGDLKYTVYYRNDQTSTSTSSFSFKLNVIGNYVFYVIFEDGAGNKMDTEEFLKEVDDEEELQDNLFTIKFNIQDNAQINVDAAIVQGVGYVGVTYTASKFTVEASGCKLTYKLYYNSSTKADETVETGWKEIPKASSVKSGYNQDGFDYDAVKAFNYDGTLTFTPTKIGSYRIVCTATSEVSDRNAEATTVIRVYSEPIVYEAPSTWLRDNAWSVVFLSVGTLCLIGIIVLLFIKPKDEIDND